MNVLKWFHISSALVNLSLDWLSPLCDADSGGMPDRSVTLTGSPDAIQYVAFPLRLIVVMNTKMNTPVVEHQWHLLDESTRAAKRLLTEIVEKGRPTPAFHHNEGPGMSVQRIVVPASKAGLVIGKGGETIKQLQVREARYLGPLGNMAFPFMYVA